MNFFGHAAVAGHFKGDAAFVLGAMLPDFSTMIAARPPRVGHELVALGVRFHHATDEAFHELEAFQRMSRAAIRFFDEQGLGRGSSRAVAHVGVELLIDEVLADAERARSAYISALNVSRTAEIEASIDWSPDERARFSLLMTGLCERGVIAMPTATQVAERLHRILARRPRLCFAASETPLVTEWIVAARPDVVASVPALIEALIAKLSQSMAGPPAAL